MAKIEDPPSIYDILVTGGGIHGLSMACEAASRGLSTLLVEAGQIGESSSSSPLNLLDAGINELERLNFPNALRNIKELSLLQQKAPHLLHPLPTFMVKNPRAGSTLQRSWSSGLYRFFQHEPCKMSLSDWADLPLAAEQVWAKPVLAYGVNTMRLAVAMAKQLLELDGKFLLQHGVVSSERKEDKWIIGVEHSENKSRTELQAKYLINCAGSHANHVLEEALEVSSRGSASHYSAGQLFINFPQCWPAALHFQQQDRSLIGVYPYDNNTISVNPIVAEEDSDEAREQAIDEFIALWNIKATVAITRENIIHARWNSRPIVEDPSTDASRRQNQAILDLNNPGAKAPLLNLFGENLIQHRVIAEQALDILQNLTDAQRASNFAERPLPGAEFDEHSPQQMLTKLRKHYDQLPAELIARLLFTYGTLCWDILGSALQIEDLGENFGHGLFEREVDYLRDKEWAHTADDILWRRTFLGVVFSAEQRKGLAAYLGNI